MNARMFVVILAATPTALWVYAPAHPARIDGEPPIGAVMPFAGPSGAIPEGWLLCDGSEANRADFEELFLVLGVRHGHGDMSTTFNLPDYRGRSLRGVDLGAARDPDSASRGAMNPGGNVGDFVGSVQDEAIQSHRHDDGGHGHVAGTSLESHSHGTSGHTHTGITDVDSHKHSLFSSGLHNHAVINSKTGQTMQLRDGGGSSNFIIDSTDAGSGFRGNFITNAKGSHAHNVTVDSHSHTLAIDSASDTISPDSHSHAVTISDGFADLGDPTDSGTGAGLPKHGAETRVKNAYVNFIILAESG